MRFCFEGMEENGSEGLDDLIKSEAAKGDAGYFDGVDCVCIVSGSPTYSDCQNDALTRNITSSLTITG